MDGERSCRHQQQKASVELQRADWLRVWGSRTSVPPSMPQQPMEQRLCQAPSRHLGMQQGQKRKTPLSFQGYSQGEGDRQQTGRLTR